MKSIKKIKWLRDFPEKSHGEEPDSHYGKQVKPFKTGVLKWSYKKDAETRVQELEMKDGKHCFLDVEHGHEIGGIPRDAFDFVN